MGSASPSGTASGRSSRSPARSGRPAWAGATAEAWLNTVIEPDAKRVRTGGDKRLARLLLDGLHQRLFVVDAA